MNDQSPTHRGLVRDHPDSAQPEDIPTAPEGYDAVRFNAVKHGILSRHTVLPHEDREEYRALHAALVAEHQPAGPTEAHLVEELAGLMWRQRRVLQAEGTRINDSLRGTVRRADEVVAAAVPFASELSGRYADLPALLSLSPDEVAAYQRQAREDLDAARAAAAILDRGGAEAYDQAQATLPPEARDGWQEEVEAEEYPPSADGLAEFIHGDLMPLCRQEDALARHHAAIRAQALGEGLPVLRLEKLTRYETHLDRKFQRTLGMLVKLRELGK